MNKKLFIVRGIVSFVAIALLGTMMILVPTPEAFAPTSRRAPPAITAVTSMLHGGLTIRPTRTMR
jgi:hypothetical protein